MARQPRKVPFVLDQGEEGACTGFGLAATVNFLLHNRSGAPQLKRPAGASARMLYEMAKRYDEWDGTDYEGSSIRGAVLDRFTHHCHIAATGNDSYRFKNSSTNKKEKKTRKPSK